MPQTSYSDFAPYKVVRCRFFDPHGQAIYGYSCPEGGFCRDEFLHPHDRGWPGLDPKPAFRLERSPSSMSPPPSRKRARSPFDTPRRSPSPDRYYGRRRRSLSPAKSIGRNGADQRYSPVSRNSQYRELSPHYRRGRSPPPKDESRIHRPSNISGPNNIPLASSRSNRARLSVDTSHISSSPELRTPSDCQDRNAGSPRHNYQKCFGSGKLKPHENPRDDLPAERYWKGSIQKKPVSPRRPRPASEHEVVPLVKRVGPPSPKEKVTNHTDSAMHYSTAPNNSSSPSIGPLESNEPFNILALINKLTRVHLRLLDDRKAYEDESLKLQAFETLAVKFEMPVTGPLTTPLISRPATGFGPFGSTFTTSATYTNAFGTAASVVPPSKETPTGPRRMVSGQPAGFPHTHQSNGKDKRLPEFVWDGSTDNNASQLLLDEEMLAATGNHQSGTPSYQMKDDAGQTIAHHALLETLGGIRERQMNIEKRVRDDFDEMALVLETIWMGIFRIQNVSQAGNIGNNAGNQTLTSAVVQSNTRQPVHTAGSSRATGNPSFVISEVNRSASVALPTATDHSGKAIKKMRRVSFDDELGTSQKEKDALRRLEEKIISMERKLVKLALVEKESIKMRAELKGQKEAIDAVKTLLEEQARTITELVTAQAPPDNPKAEVEEGVESMLVDPTM